ncbi:LamG domain-containing protein [Streptomyces cocklensis]|uniref:LamG domain-containing protein n=1 Tax=Actinacidiphila cocklensis TaxID=887465 RepID=UPI0020419EBC|nr:LamG domain-containing protein [Actinacidiphila cocklensis]MDD1064161.1 LamG domain-containing protein [Actinacidiphila cocklensis]
MDAARKSGKAVPVTAMTDENTDVSAQPDGTLVATIHASPVRTRKAGAWTAIDTTLQAAPDGGVAPKAVLPGLEFSGGGSQPLVRISRAGKELALSWPDPLPKPVLDGDTAEYRDVLPDVDLRMTATVDGYTQLVVIKTAEAAKNPALAQLHLGMSSTDLVMQENADGSLSAVDGPGGGTVFEVQQPMMFDSSAAAQDGPGTAQATQAPAGARAAGTTGAADDPADGGAHAAAVDVQIADDQSSLTLTPDQGLLTAPGTVYPVMIDPETDAPHPGGWAGISRANPAQEFWKFSYNGTHVEDFGTGYCAAPACSANDVKRVMYSIPVHGRGFNGKNILAAEFDVKESHSYSCTKEPVQLYTTGAISTATNWNNSSSTTGTTPFWGQYLQTITDAKGWSSSSCPAANLEFGNIDPKVSTTLKSKVQQAADNNWTNLTLGLKAQDETDPDAWKRFTDDATLQVMYNLPPSQALPKNLTMTPGSVCQPLPILINKWPTLIARAYDPDGDQIGVQFAVSWDNGDGAKFARHWFSTEKEGNTPSYRKASGSLFSVALPPQSGVTSTTKIGWEVRVWDGYQWGSWSSAGDPTDCYFKVDTVAPAGPVVTSSAFPGSSDTDPDGIANLPWTDGVGKYGTFTFDTAATDAVKYEYGLDAPASAAHTVATSGGAPASVRLLQQEEGLHNLSVRALDASGNASSVSSYVFNVKAGQTQHEGWAMDDAAGTGSLAGSGGSFQATVAGAAAGGAVGHAGTALSLPGGLASDGTPADYASTSGAVVDTSGSFTVSAWVNLADASTARAAVSQNGSYIGGFSLGLYDGKWTFKTSTQDAPGYMWQSAASTQPVVTGTWTHLTGVYNQAAHTETVYVNGVPSAAVAVPVAPMATGALQFGRILWKGPYADAWQGSVDDVHLWNRALTASEAAGLAADTAVTTGVPAKAVFSMDQSGGTMIGTGEASDAAIRGTVTTGVIRTADKAVHFGTDGSAVTSRPQVDGTRTFSVSAWVRIPNPAAGDTSSKIAVTQNGVYNSEFSLYYSTYYQRWIFGRYAEDTATATLTRTMQTNCTGNASSGTKCIGSDGGEWTHLVGVSDATAHQNQLYVNGYLVSTTPYTQTTPWPTPGGLELGADNRAGVDAEFLGGDIDDARAFDRILTGSEIQTMIQQSPQPAGRWKFNDATSATPRVSPDDLNAHPASLSETAAISTNNPWIGTGALSLSGPTSYAATQSAPLDTDEGFTFAGWTQFAAAPDQDGTVLSLGDGTDNAVTVRWHYLRTDHIPDLPADFDTIEGEWQAESVSGGTTRVHTVVRQSAVGQAGVWTHLAVTYDAFSNQLALYVNGQLEEKLCDDEDNPGTCTNDVSYAGANQPFEATSGLKFGPLQSAAGTDHSLSGQIDDVWAYRGVLTPAQIASLITPVELDSTTGT